MALSRKTLIGLGLGGALVLTAIRAIVPSHEPSSPSPMLLLGPVQDTAPPALTPDVCRIAVSPPPECAKAWDANRAHFFGRQPGPSSAAASSQGEQP